MYRVPSTSQTYGPSARATTYGRPPTALNARIDEFTPPGIARVERSNSSSLDGTPRPTHTTGSQPAATHAGAQTPTRPPVDVVTVRWSVALTRDPGPRRTIGRST